MDIYIIKNKGEFDHIRHELHDQGNTWSDGESLVPEEDTWTTQLIQKMDYFFILCVDEEKDVMFERMFKLDQFLEDDTADHRYYVVEELQDDSYNN